MASRKLLNVLIAALLLPLIYSCETFPSNYGPVLQDVPECIPAQVLADIDVQHATRNEAVARLGKPDDPHVPARAFGYGRCTASPSGEVSILLFNPFSTTDKHTRDCQMASVWFNQEGGAVRSASNVRRDSRVCPP